MTYETGTANDLEDLLSKLSTFATTTHGGWTQGYLNTTNGWFELHKGNLSASFKYPKVETAATLSLHQATGFINTSTAPGAHTADSGNGWNTNTTGHTNANLETERCVRAIGNGPFPSYYFFADDTGSNDYIHVVVEPTSGMYRHFGFGILSKFGNNWTGGEYVYGHYQENATNALATDPNTQVLLDGQGGTADRLRAATLKIGSLANQGAAVWGVSAALATANLLTDTAGNIRQQIHGGYRVGMTARGFGNPVGSFSSGAIAMSSIDVFYKDPNNARVYLLGWMTDVRMINVRNFEPAQEVTIGSDVWKIFPQSIRTTATIAYRSGFSGIAYRKVP